MQTILFYGRNGAKAKERARELRKSGKGRIVIYDVAAWEGGRDGADAFEIMDCVSYFDRQRIEAAFGAESKVINPDPVEWPGANFEAANIAAKELAAELKSEPKKRGLPRKAAT